MAPGLPPYPTVSLFVPELYHSRLDNRKKKVSGNPIQYRLGLAPSASFGILFTNIHTFLHMPISIDLDKNIKYVQLSIARYEQVRAVLRHFNTQIARFNSPKATFIKISCHVQNENSLHPFCTTLIQSNSGDKA